MTRLLKLLMGILLAPFALFIAVTQIELIIGGIIVIAVGYAMFVIVLRLLARLFRLLGITPDQVEADLNRIRRYRRRIKGKT